MGDHWDNIGQVVPPTSPSNVTQEVNFLSWTQGQWGGTSLPFGFLG